MQKLSILSFLISAMLVFSCKTNTYDVVVKVNPDGSCSREFMVTDCDPSFMAGDTSKNPFPMHLDSSWKINWKYSTSFLKGEFQPWPAKNWKPTHDTSRHLILTMRAHKDYISVDTMAKTFRYNHSQWRDIVPRIALRKSFAFFFTYFTYTECYPTYNSLTRVPIQKYLSEQEISTYFCNNPIFEPGMNGAEIKDKLDILDKKKSEWLHESFFEEVYHTLPSYLHLLKPKTIDSSQFMSAKDSVFELLKKTEDLKENFAPMLDKHFKTNGFTQNDSLIKVISSQCDQVEERVMKPFSMQLRFALVLPGKVLHSNADRTNGDTLFWKVDPYRFTFTDDELKAESRVTNLWAFVVLALLVIGVSVFLVFRRK